MRRFAERLSLLLVGGAFALASAGCNYAYNGASQVSVAPVVPPRAWGYCHFTAPLVLPGDLTLGGEIEPPPTRKLVYLRIPFVNTDFSVGRADIESAMKRAGIEKLAYADYEYLNVVNYVRVMTVHAYGYRAEDLEDSAAESPRP